MNTQENKKLPDQHLSKSIHVRTLSRKNDQLTGRGGMLHNRGGRGAAPA
jgi:hypothetical protein